MKDRSKFAANCIYMQNDNKTSQNKAYRTEQNRRTKHYKIIIEGRIVGQQKYYENSVKDPGCSFD